MSWMKSSVFVKRLDFIALLFDLVTVVRERIDPQSEAYLQRTIIPFLSPLPLSLSLAHISIIVFSMQSTLQIQYQQFLLHFLVSGEEACVLLTLRHLTATTPAFLTYAAENKDFIASFLYYSAKYLTYESNSTIMSLARALWRKTDEIRSPWIKDTKESINLSSTSARASLSMTAGIIPSDMITTTSTTIPSTTTATSVSEGGSAATTSSFVSQLGAPGPGGVGVTTSSGVVALSSMVEFIGRLEDRQANFKIKWQRKRQVHIYKRERDSDRDRDRDREILIYIGCSRMQEKRSVFEKRNKNAN